MKKVGFYTLGCKVNQYESEAMITLFKDKGYEISDFESECDIYVINTCTVTGTGDRKSRQMIHRAHQKNPDSVIVVAGCYSQVSTEEVKKIDGVSLILGTNDRNRIVELVEEYIRNEKKDKTVVVSDIMKIRNFEDMWISSYEGRTRAFVKIEEGCTEFCSYCIIPYARGPVRSRPLESIKAEVIALAANGYREIVLTGIHIGSYGRDCKNLSLIDAIECVNSIDGIERIRLGSVEPRVLTKDFINRIRLMPKVCDHFHISLQSGCDNTLKRMNRKYTCEEYAKCVRLLRNAYENPAITTDIITGFPGETDEDFETSLRFMEEIRFSEAHIFPYSPRKGTKAAAMPGQIEKKVKNKRASVMIEKSKELHSQYLSSFVDKECEVLIERCIEDNIYEGHTANYIKVKVQSNENISKKICRVRINSISDDSALASLL